MSIFTLEVTDGIALITMNDPSQPQNVLNTDVQQDYDALFDKIEADASLRGLVFTSSKPGCFLAGADISLLQSIKTEDDAYQNCKTLHAFFARIVGLPFPTAVAIDGTCLGGGLELSLAFDYRVASTAPATKIGVPEIQLGVLPGGGGTQRIPRLIDLPSALDLLLTGRQIDARRAKKLGLIDAVSASETVIEVATKLVQQGKPKRKLPLKHRLLRFGPIRKAIISKARQGVMAKTKGHYPAPLKILDVVDRGLGASLEKGLDLEARGFAQLLMTPESKQFVNLFFATTDLKKDTGVDVALKPRPTRSVGVFGAGLMGAGIAYVTVDRAKLPVRLKDVTLAGLQNGVKAVGRLLDKKLARRRLRPEQYLQQSNLLTTSLDYSGFKAVDVVIEAVFEDLELKRKMVADVEKVSSERAAEDAIIFATNTSAIPITEIARGADHPERVVGMHYFSPVEKMPLLEVVRGEATADWAVASVVALGKAQGKTVIVVNDGPGFFTTRVLVPYNMEAMRLVLEGVAIERVDQALESFGMPVGPIKLMDEVGIDVGAHIVTTLNDAFGERIPLIVGMERVLEDKRFGRKNGRGFYRYAGKKPGKEVDPTIYEVAGVENAGSNQLVPAEIVQRVIFSFLNEAAYCLQEGILRSARDGDIGAIFGLGFPPFLGGPFRYMDSLGLSNVLATLRDLEGEHGARFAPAPLIIELAEKGNGFYAS